MFSRFFIERPIFASVISIVIVIAGTVTLGTLPIAQYPEITPPTVEVSAIYPGAKHDRRQRKHRGQRPRPKNRIIRLPSPVSRPTLDAPGPP